MLDLRRLSLLRELRIHGTIAAVAEAINYSPSSISQQLALLEDEAGAPLFRRVGRRLALTPEAEILVAHTHTLLDTIERAESELASASSTVAGTVTIAAFQSALLALLPDALTSLRSAHPELRVRVVQHEPETALADTWAREYDMVIAEEYPAHAAPRHAGLVRRALTADQIRLACPPGMDDGRTIAGPSDVADLPWVMEPAGAASRHFAEQLCRQAGFEPDVRFETADLQAQIRLIESGNAVALIPDLMWAGASSRCQLVALAGAPHRAVFTAVREASAERPAIIALDDALAASAARLAQPPTTGAGA